MLVMRYYQPDGITRLRPAGGELADGTSSDEMWTRVLAGARQEYLEKRPSNLTHLLESRYGWMNAYVAGKKDIVELGSGAGFCREFVTNPNLKLTDFIKHPWIDREVDALRTPFDDGSLDAVIMCHVLHHLANPMQFFREMRRVLRPGGHVLIQELNSSISMLAINRVLRHEGWNYGVDVFDDRAIVNNPRDPTSPNIAVPELLFSDAGIFERRVEGFRVVRNDLCEFLSFALSGGVNAKTPTINLGPAMLSRIDRVDRALIGLLPSVFALGRRVVLERPLGD
ncbi:MAG TPA: class I SAM-dependent methyltransferase [Polyangiaceae bacterium]|jgi:SAM-dependent methyltransferase|nr:class I SAM-dependent methyltransferase [Polyangiaceae bacterium]